MISLTKHQIEGLRRVANGDAFMGAILNTSPERARVILARITGESQGDR